MADLNNPQAWRTSQYKEAMSGPNKEQSSFKGSPAQQALSRETFQPGGAAYKFSEGVVPQTMQNVGHSIDQGVQAAGAQMRELISPPPGARPPPASRQEPSTAASTPTNTIPSAPPVMALPPKSLPPAGKEYEPTPAALANANIGKRGNVDIGPQPTSALGTASPGTGDSGVAGVNTGAAPQRAIDYGAGTPRGAEPSGGGAKYGAHAWDDKPGSTGQGAFSVMGGGGPQAALSGQSGQQPSGGSGMNLADLYKQAMTPINTHAPLMEMMAQVSQRKQARMLLEQGIHAQSGLDQANAHGEWIMKQGQQHGEYGLRQQGMQGQQALETGRQTGEYGLQREQMGNESAQAIEGQRESAAGQRQALTTDTTRRGQDISALTTLAGQRASRENQEAQQSEARRKEFSAVAQDQIIKKLLDNKAMPESVYDYDEKGHPHYNEDRARAYAAQIMGDDAAASSRAGEDPMGPRNPQQASNLASEVMVVPGESNIFSPDKKPSVSMQRTALPAPATEGEAEPQVNEAEEQKQPPSRRTK